MKLGEQRKKMNRWCCFVAFFLSCSLPVLANADIAGDIKGGMTASAAAQKAINDGMDPVAAALAAALVGGWPGVPLAAAAPSCAELGGAVETGQIKFAADFLAS